MDIIQLIINYLPTAIQYFLAFALLITVVVFIHELGHYSVGRWCGIGVETFSIGMGKQVWGKKDKSGTLWRIAILPIGGYVKFCGDEDPSGKKSEVSENIKDDIPIAEQLDFLQDLSRQLNEFNLSKSGAILLAAIN